VRVCVCVCVFVCVCVCVCVCVYVCDYVCAARGQSEVPEFASLRMCKFELVHDS